MSRGIESVRMALNQRLAVAGMQRAHADVPGNAIFRNERSASQKNEVLAIGQEFRPAMGVFASSRIWCAPDVISMPTNHAARRTHKFFLSLRTDVVAQKTYTPSIHHQNAATFLVGIYSSNARRQLFPFYPRRRDMRTVLRLAGSFFMLRTWGVSLFTSL